MSELTFRDVAAVEDTNAQPLSIALFVAWCIRFTDNRVQGRQMRGRTARRQALTSIIETVRTLILKPVYAELSMRQIAELAQVSEGSVYRLFGDRKRLTACVQRYVLTQIVTVARKLVIDLGAPILTLHAVAEAVGLTEDELRFVFPTAELLLEYIQPEFGDWNI